MYISIEPSNGVPIYEQIVRQVKFAVAEGTLVPGQLVPSVRDLAKQLAVNPNTIQRAYQQLQSDLVLETLRGRGQAVCTGAVEHCIDQRAEIIASRLTQVVNEALGSGLEPDQLRKVFERAIASFRESLNHAADSQSENTQAANHGIKFQQEQES